MKKNVSLLEVKLQLSFVSNRVTFSIPSPHHVFIYCLTPTPREMSCLSATRFFN